jgi:hypothetical protein
MTFNEFDYVDIHVLLLWKMHDGTGGTRTIHIWIWSRQTNDWAKDELLYFPDVMHIFKPLYFPSVWSLGKPPKERRIFVDLFGHKFMSLNVSCTITTYKV